MSRPRQRATPGCSGSGIVAGDPMGYAESWHKADKALHSLARFMERHGHGNCHIIMHAEWPDAFECITCRDETPGATWRIPKAYRRGR
jgi:hypothetical protein